MMTIMIKFMVMTTMMLLLHVLRLNSAACHTSALLPKVSLKSL